MSMFGPPPPGRRTDQVGETVASYPTYEAAQKAVSQLIASEVPARQIAIVGTGLRSIERITGRLGYATAARSGAINGLLLGLFFSAFLVLGSPDVPVQAFVGVLFVGVAVGMLMSILIYSFVRRRRDYASVMQVIADHYDVTVDGDAAGRARQVLGAPAPAPSEPVAPTPPAEAPPVRPEPPRTPPASSDDSEPPRYGERLPPVASPEPPAEQPPSGAEPADPRA